VRQKNGVFVVLFLYIMLLSI